MGTSDIIAVALLSLGVLFALLNWMMLFATWWSGRFHSFIPPIGAACMAVGALLLPPTRPYAWLAVLLDVSALPFLFVFPCLVWDIWRTRRSERESS